ncbi:MAG TPA: tRNA (adenosine(37)-N6)-threonylcarbamoyltransferase complex dimerization subunit type 1 TsaB [Pyrinomonadaceae bacterium]
MGKNSETLVLSVDTATETRSVAVSRGSRLLALEVGEGRNTHSANVLSEIDAALRLAGVSLREIELYAVAAGPGSFTGLRAGLATLKAFAATFERPVVGVQTLHGVARAAGAYEKILAAIPAGRGEVFAQLLSVSKEGRVRELDEAAHVSPERLLERVAAETGAGGVVWAGSGSLILAESIAERARLEGFDWKEDSEEPLGEESPEREARSAPRSWRLARTQKILAAHLSALALDALGEGRASNAQDLRAIYVRPSDVEIKEQCLAPSKQPS